MDPAFKTITLAQILAHQAGLAPFTDDKEMAALPPFTGDALEQRRQFTKFLLTHKPAFKPGAQYSYSNAGYTIAAAMAERVTRRSWETLMKKYVFIPLKLTSAMFGWPSRDTEAAPWGHKRDGDRWVPQDPDGQYQLGPRHRKNAQFYLTLQGTYTEYFLCRDRELSSINNSTVVKEHNSWALT